MIENNKYPSGYCPRCLHETCKCWQIFNSEIFNNSQKQNANLPDFSFSVDGLFNKCVWHQIEISPGIFTYAITIDDVKQIVYKLHQNGEFDDDETDFYDTDS